MSIKIIQGDITKLHVDAIVNAANPSLLGGGGVDGAIHRAAGPKLLEECKTLGGANPGQAKITHGYNLPAKWVIHTPGPVWQGGNHDEEVNLRHSYENSLCIARSYELHSIAFPSISTGVYGYPIEEASKVALSTIDWFLKKCAYYPMEVICVLHNERDYQTYIKTAQELRINYEV
ncbi:O-acetyl-ADP-ribose deacetylase [Nitratiruptor tergarcus]|uniref:O-acetyl-ADP-ribose deacetylase (Regulator of RNase III), contains Macro domain n=1 Tax=Nitratiruptor tergarcus DSM 16512 TaxID=1069081 RepID=A0A1W1WQX6_9BACT|nr:O-acetyl-ADP-ribose deacetylase [Nitratiruptor tergarcus]SMC08714.1 O-acetyl-ADP-ribose deacetylase (regulator of RNase III), contains Macro domain [Nitratiruptor tergarcus DSM 16512]